MTGSLLLSVLDVAAAQTAGGATSEPPAYIQFLPLVAMAVIFYFLILRPQMKRQKDHQLKISELKKGDQVVTAGGLLAKVIKVEDNTVELEIAPNVKVRAVKSTLGEIVPPGGAPAAND
ncbi:protein translocase subunit yajC [Novosphingobium nitrogenifigens DSM 19370]|uniref:Sec translocon accessory complex subunit YajC n=1 Tax=Novosphingobium nitrogenifigens DSM 19370 TaxID=983920 RepID=F1Z9F8_9SPHN|nr:preprotein translocase subunit YajC [Novosphingobium nitrogenifigens]EGD58784.1 protein translocase subunit yajC [Novosphingobium nitrogenifigens DSM 19370]